MYRVNMNQPSVRKADINRLINGLANDFFSELKPTSVRPQYNVIETKDDFKLEIAIPGVSKKDIGLNVEKGLLNIKVNKEVNKETKFIRKEFNYLSFDKNFKLPKSVEAGNISAKMEKGILVVSLPKKEEAKEQPARNITIK